MGVVSEVEPSVQMPCEVTKPENSLEYETLWQILFLFCTFFDVWAQHEVSSVLILNKLLNFSPPNGHVFLVIVTTLQGDICPRTLGLDKRKQNITSQRLKDSWNATNADTCVLGEVSHFGGSLAIYYRRWFWKGSELVKQKFKQNWIPSVFISMLV